MSETEAPPVKKAKYDFQAASERRKKYINKKHSKSDFIRNAKQLGLDTWCERVGIPRNEIFMTFPKDKSMFEYIEFLFEQWYTVTSETTKEREWTTTQFLYFAEMLDDGSKLESDLISEGDITIFLYLKNNVSDILRQINGV